MEWGADLLKRNTDNIRVSTWDNIGLHIMKPCEYWYILGAITISNIYITNQSNKSNTH